MSWTCWWPRSVEEVDRIDQPSLPRDGCYTLAGDGEGVQVYVLDTGLRVDHSEFTGRVGNGINATYTHSVCQFSLGGASLVPEVIAVAAADIAPWNTELVTGRWWREGVGTTGVPLNFEDPSYRCFCLGQCCPGGESIGLRAWHRITG